jgi:hypothetical protein
MNPPFSGLCGILTGADTVGKRAAATCQVGAVSGIPENEKGIRWRPRDGRNSWEDFRNLLKRNRPILHQLGKKPHEIKAPLGTRAPQQIDSVKSDDVAP